MKYYLAGPMQGIPAYNFPAFKEARERLRLNKYEVHCPAEEDETNGFDTSAPLPADFLPKKLAECFQKVLDCDAVIVLPGWAKSEGAKAEVLIAVETGKPIFSYHHHRPELLEELHNIKIVTRAEMISQ